jgi:hypothetical protein
MLTGMKPVSVRASRRYVRIKAEDHVFSLMQARQRALRRSRVFLAGSKNSASAGQYSPQVRQRFSWPMSVSLDMQKRPPGAAPAP